jgi:hypothetical protein
VKRKFVPEFEVREKRRRAGFVPSERDDVDTELWQVWCRSSAGEERRATFQDMRRAGLAKRKR